MLRSKTAQVVSPRFPSVTNTIEQVELFQKQQPCFLRDLCSEDQEVSLCIQRGESFYSAGGSESAQGEAKHFPRLAPFSPFASRCYFLTSSFSSAQFLLSSPLSRLQGKSRRFGALKKKNVKFALLIFLKRIKIAWINTLPTRLPTDTHTHPHPPRGLWKGLRDGEAPASSSVTLVKLGLAAAWGLLSATWGVLEWGGGRIVLAQQETPLIKNGEE